MGDLSDLVTIEDSSSEDQDHHFDTETWHDD